jgi:hypothetical protein
MGICQPEDAEEQLLLALTALAKQFAPIGQCVTDVMARQGAVLIEYDAILAEVERRVWHISWQVKVWGELVRRAEMRHCEPMLNFFKVITIPNTVQSDRIFVPI